ncbi:MAG: hypothetical protein NC123_05925 [Butyrivibrio sp.]|nr:hypothetical protein [Acetatifactor muris]MCM1559067.1 hypothetical protein [Butyrivibrio sp.]
MKKSTVRVTVILIVVIAGLVALYCILLSKMKSDAGVTKMTPVQSALSRDLTKNYPATVKEVIKYYTEIEKCFYNEECTDAEIEALGMQARMLYDQELLDNNEVADYITKLKAEVKGFKDAKRRLISIVVASSANVDYFSEDGYEFARLYCGYTVKENNGQNLGEGRIYLLRKDADRHWKIYGWETDDNVNVGG